MGNKKQVRKARPDAAGVSDFKFHGSLRSQLSIKKEWQLKSALKSCKAQISLWESKLQKAREGVARNTRQISVGQGAAHGPLQSYVSDAAQAERMIASFKEQAANFQKEIEALQPDADKALERATAQRAVASLVLARLEIDRKLDNALEGIRKILESRAVSTATIRERIAALDFDSSVNLDEQRFQNLFGALPQGLARESEEWATWFLGREKGRSPYQIHYHDVTLPETLYSHNAFQPGDCPNLTSAEIAEVERIVNAACQVCAPPQEAKREEGPAKEVPAENIQWALPR
jgi:hypothetical protein